MLICPKCHEQLKKEEHVWRCAKGHSYDIARRGYVNLVLGSHKASGDDKAMVRSRTRFLSHGYYHILQKRLATMLQKLALETLIDAGCGEGYYTNYFQEVLPATQIYGFDLSKHAIDEACKAHRGVTYGVCNIFHLPIAKHCADGVVSVFAPVDSKENYRVLKTGGYFLKVGPGPKHLYELKQLFYTDVYENEIETGYSGFTLLHEEIVEDTITIQDAQDIWALFQMTPYYWRTPKQQAEALKQCKELTTQISFHIALYRKESMK